MRKRELTHDEHKELSAALSISRIVLWKAHELLTKSSRKNSTEYRMLKRAIKASMDLSSIMDDMYGVDLYFGVRADAALSQKGLDILMGVDAEIDSRVAASLSFTAQASAQPAPPQTPKSSP